VVAKEKSTDLRGATDWLEQHTEMVISQFISLSTLLPSYGETVDRQLREYIDGMGDWVRANDQWSFESQRYFGPDGISVFEKREVALLPKQELLN